MWPANDVVGADTPGYKAHVFTATLDITSRRASSGGRLLAAWSCAALIVDLELNGPGVIINRRSTGMSQSLKTYAIFAVCMLLISVVITPAAHAQGAATETLFKAKCAMCHGTDATGNTAMGKKFNIPDLRAPEIQKKTKAELVNAIAKGKNKMPAFEGKLTSDEVNELATYVRQLKK